MVVAKPFRLLLKPALLPLLFCAALPLGAQGKTVDSSAEAAERWKAAALPLEEGLLPDPPAGNERSLARNVSIGGTALGFVLSGCGIAMAFQGAARGPDREGVHRGAALAASGSLVAALFASAVIFYSRPPDGGPVR